MALQSLNSVPTALQVSKFVMMHINNHYFFFFEKASKVERRLILAGIILVLSLDLGSHFCSNYVDLVLKAKSNLGRCGLHLMWNMLCPVAILPASCYLM